MAGSERELEAEAARLERLLHQVEAMPDTAVRAQMAEIVSGLLTFYGGGLSRLLEIVETRCDGPSRARIEEALTADALVSHLLLLHGLHPVDLRTRVEQGLAAVRPALAAHGGDVELLGLEGGTARLRLRGNCSGCPSSAATLRTTVEQALHRSAPDLLAIESVEDPERVDAPAGFVPMSALL